ncbi:hypothetical protein R6Q59_018401 [Mikania micrantha]
MVDIMTRKHPYTLLLLVLLIISKATLDSAVGFDHHHHETEKLYIPEGIVKYQPLGAKDHDMVRKLNAFQICLDCKCCIVVSDPSTCSNMPCCFGIDCQLPNKPYGVCAFVPRTCNCTSCGSP